MSGLEKTAAGLKLIAVAERLREIEADRVAGRIKPIQAGDMRGKVLCEGVMTLALHLGVTLKAVNAIAREKPLGRVRCAILERIL
jgi:hypothetical protein